MCEWCSFTFSQRSFRGPARFSAWTCAVPAVYQWHKWWCFIIHSALCRWLCSVPSGSDKRGLHNAARPVNINTMGKTVGHVLQCEGVCISVKRKPTINYYNIDGQQEQVPKETTYNTLEQIPWNYSVKITWAGTPMHRRSKPGMPGLLELYVKLSESVMKKWKTLHTSSLLDLSWNMPRVHGVLTYKKMLTSLRAFKVRLPDLSFMTTGENPVWPLCFHPSAGTPCKTDASLHYEPRSQKCLNLLSTRELSNKSQNCLYKVSNQFLIWSQTCLKIWDNFETWKGLSYNLVSIADYASRRPSPPGGISASKP